MYVCMLCVFAVVAFSYSVQGHMCILQERYDVAKEQRRWSLPSQERCHCQAVMAVKKGNWRTPCRPQVDVGRYGQDIWFTDYPNYLLHKANWTRDRLDELLERKILCGKSLFNDG